MHNLSDLQEELGQAPGSLPDSVASTDSQESRRFRDPVRASGPCYQLVGRGGISASASAAGWAHLFGYSGYGRGVELNEARFRCSCCC